jgi:PAS domain S-box-containing protein
MADFGVRNNLWSGLVFLPSVNRNRVLEWVPAMAVLVPVCSVLVLNSDMFKSVFDHESVHLVSELLTMLGALFLAGLLLLRHGRHHMGIHYWTACSLIVQGEMVGFHLLTMNDPIGEVIHTTGYALAGLTALLVFAKPLSKYQRLHPYVPMLLILIATALGMTLMSRPNLMQELGLLGEGSFKLNWVMAVGSGAYLIITARIIASMVKHRTLGLIWMLGYFVMLAGTALAYGSSTNMYEGWLYHLLRSCAMSVLLFYVGLSTVRDFTLVGSIEGKLKQSEARYRALTENTSDIIFILNSDDVFSYVSPAAARIIGKLESDMTGSQPGGYTHPDDISIVTQGIIEARSNPGQSIRIGTIRVKTDEDAWVHVEGVYTCMENDANVQGTVLNYRDVTEHHQSQQDLSESRNRTSRLIQNLPGMVYRCRVDNGLTVEYVSDYCETLTGYKPEELIMGKGVSNRDIIHSGDFERVRQSVWLAIKSRKPYEVEYRFHHRDGTIRWVMERGVGIPGADGRVKTVEGLILDVTDLVKSRSDLKRAKFSVENATDALYWIDQTGRIVEVNEMASHYLGYSRNELLSMTLFDISGDLRQEDWQTVWEDVRHESSVLVEAEHVTNTGRHFPVEVSSIFLSFEGGEYHCCFVRDITERKEVDRQVHKLNEDLELRVLERTRELEEAQDRLVTSEKMAALGNLVAGVAHEINTPLGIGVTAASYLEKKGRECRDIYDDGKMKKSDFENFLSLTQETSGLLLTNLQRAAELIQGFKKVSVDQSDEQRRTFYLDEYLAEIINSLKPELARHDHSVELTCAPSLDIDSFPGAIAQVITNLVMNSIKHGFENHKGGQVWINVDADSSRIRILYKDDGKGMSPDQLRQLYDPFYTTKRGRGGSGLGMNIVFNLMTQLLKGSIECVSDVGQGVVFVLDFPRQTPSDKTSKEKHPLPEMV